MRIVFALVLLVHALIHLMGFAKAFRLAQLSNLTQAISPPVGLLWLAGAVLLAVAAGMFLLGNSSWWLPAAPALLISQAVILLSWEDARFGTLANLIILLPAVMAFMDARPTSYQNVYRRVVAEGLARRAESRLVTEADLERLPAPVGRYLRNAGVVGTPQPRWCKAVFTGAIRKGKDSPWMDFVSEQYNFFDQPTRAFLIRSKMYGLPVDGLHLFRGPDAFMRIKVASLVEVVDARGPNMNQAETVTLFNDMCVLAPGTLVDPGIRWESDGPRSATARFTNQGTAIAARLSFDARGDPVDFVSEDRFLSADGKTFRALPWSTPLSNFRDYAGRRLPATGEAVWRAPEGAYAYGRFQLQQIEYDKP